MRIFAEVHMNRTGLYQQELSNYNSFHLA